MTLGALVVPADRVVNDLSLPPLRKESRYIEVLVDTVDPGSARTAEREGSHRWHRVVRYRRARRIRTALFAGKITAQLRGGVMQNYIVSRRNCGETASEIRSIRERSSKNSIVDSQI